jgi:hypothetical protein
MDAFRLVGEIIGAETIAEGPGIQDRARLTKFYGRGTWRKRKGTGTIELPNGQLRRVELHWYEAHGIGRKELKIKHYLE